MKVHKKNIAINARLKLRCTSKHWPSAGVYNDRPETWTYSLRTEYEVIATGTLEEISAFILEMGFVNVAR